MTFLKDKWFDPILLIGLFISITIGIGMVLIGNDSISSLIISFLSTVITLLVDAIYRIQKTSQLYLDAAGLSRIFNNKSIGSELYDIANDYIRINDYKFDHFTFIAKTIIDECKSKLHEIANSAVIVPAKSKFEYEVVGIEKALKTIKVIHAGSMEFWKTERGKQLLELNRKAINRGIVITRIFFLSKESTQHYTETIKLHKEAGISVYILNPNNIPDSNIDDYVIFDDQVLLESLSKIGQRHEKIIIDPPQVKDKIDDFERLLRYSNSYTE